MRTLTNAIENGRLAQAYMLTGVRGVGKTTTARIIARSLNCIGADGNGQATITPCGVCANCLAIANDRHVDVLEMDAASRTGVDDVREIIEGVRYGPINARYKIYIIDEVHMLTRNAFNALLKTLEEPPPHTKFIFATTEIRKVPVTVLSRCQRFDLKRVESTVLQSHFAKVAAQEQVAAEAEALAMLATAADGSVRDGLSLLDQAIARADAGGITAAQVQAMLGLADRARLIELFTYLHTGKVAEALAVVETLRAMGAEALILLHDLADITHLLTRSHVVPELLKNAAMPELERGLAQNLGANLSLPSLTRTWQMLLKGMEEVQHAPNSFKALEMVLIRLCYAAELPSPADLIKQLQEIPHTQTPAPGGSTGSPTEGGSRMRLVAQGGGVRAVAAPVPQTQGMAEAAIATATATAPMPEDFPALVALFAQKREMVLHTHLLQNTHLVAFAPPSLTLRLTEAAPPHFAGKVSHCLQQWTGKRWLLSLVQEGGAPSLAQQQQEAAQALRQQGENHPLVKAILARFVGSALKTVRVKTVPVAAISENALASDEGNSDFTGGDLSGDAESFS